MLNLHITYLILFFSKVGTEDKIPQVKANTLYTLYSIANSYQQNGKSTHSTIY